MKSLIQQAVKGSTQSCDLIVIKLSMRVRIPVRVLGVSKWLAFLRFKFSLSFRGKL